MLFILVLVLVGGVPYAASTAPGRRLVSSVVSGKIAGQVDIGMLSLTWLGPCRAGDVRVTDPDGKQVLVVGKAVVTQGLWQLIASGGQLAILTTEAVEAQLRIFDDNTVSLAAAFESPASSAAARSGEPREVIDARFEHLSGRYVDDRLEFDAPDIHLTPPTGFGGNPVALALKGHVASGPNGLDAHVVLGGDLGTADATIAYPSGGSGTTSSLAELVSAALAGGPVNLPGITATSDATIDIARVAGLAPGLLRVRQDTTLTGGTLTIEKLSVTGGAQPTVSGRVTVSGLAAQSGGERITVEPVVMNVDAVYETDNGLVLRQSGIESSFATINASGTAANLTADFKADLSRLHAQFNRLFDLQAIESAGQLEGQLTLTRASDDRVGVQLSTQARDLRLASGGRKFACGHATIQHTGDVDIAGGTVGRISSKNLNVGIDSRINVAAAGWVDLRSRGFEARVDTTDLDLADLAGRLQAVGVDALTGFAGTLTLKASGLRPGSSGPVQSDGNLEAHDLTRDGKPLAGARLRCAWSGGRLDPATSEFAVAKLTLDGAEVQADLQVAYAPVPQTAGAGTATLTTAVLAGNIPPLPNVTAQGQATVNLPLIMAVIEPFLDAKPDLQINNGQLKLTGLQVQTAGPPALKGVVDLSNVVVARAGKTQPWPPVSIDMDLGLKQGVGLECRRVRVKSTVLDLDGSGSPAGAKATLRADLGPLRQLLDSVIALPVAGLAGQPEGTLQLTRAGQDQLDYSVDLKTGAFQVRTADRDIRLTSGSVTGGGAVLLKEDRPVRVALNTFRAALDDQLNLSGSGWYDLVEDTFDADLQIPQAELAYLGAKAAECGIDNLESFQGSLALRSKVERPQQDAAIVSSGDARIDRLARDGEVLSSQGVTVQWKDLRFDPASGDLKIPSAEVRSDLLDVQVVQAAVQTGATASLSGDLTGRADLARCMDLIGQFRGTGPPAPLAGTMNFETHCAVASGVTTLGGKARVEQFAFGSGQDTITEPQVVLDYRGRMDPRQDVITVEQLDLKSQTLSMQLAGDIRDYSKSVTLALAGKYSGSCDRLSAILHGYAPGTVEIVGLQGPTADTIRIAGPLYTPGGVFDISGLQGGMALHWKSGALLALPLSAAELPASLHDGALHVPLRELSVAGGVLRLGGRIDLRGEAPMLEIPGKVQILENVTIDQNLARSLLSRMNPIFMQLAAIEGQVSLRGEDISLPLGSAITRGGGGRGHLDWSQMKVQPGGLLGELLRLSGLPETQLYAIHGSGLDFQIRDGRIHYKDFVIRFGNEFDLRFYGSVGLDDTLDLMVSLPVSAKLLDQLKVPVVGGLLANARLDIPVVGTRERPRLDLSKADLTKIFGSGTGLIPDLEKLFPPPKPKSKKP